jgi:hypothetical protein
MEPKRIQRERTKGWRTPPNTIYVGRGKGEYGKWGNPNESKDKFVAVIQYVSWFLPTAPPGFFEEVRSELKGKNLMCWCKLGNICHADVLLWIANHKEPKVSCLSCGEKVFVFKCTNSQGEMFGKYSAYCHFCNEPFVGDEVKT